MEDIPPVLLGIFLCILAVAVPTCVVKEHVATQQFQQEMYKAGFCETQAYKWRPCPSLAGEK